MWRRINQFNSSSVGPAVDVTLLFMDLDCTQSAANKALARNAGKTRRFFRVGVKKSRSVRGDAALSEHRLEEELGVMLVVASRRPQR